MDYCGPLGIAHSAFLSWPLEDQERALAWQRLKGSTHSACGTRRDEWNPDEGGDLDAFVTDQRFCEGCARIAQESKQLPKDNDGNVLPGTYVVLKRNPDRR